MLTPEEIEWISKRLDKIERKQTEMANTLKHINEKVHRLSEIEHGVSKLRIEQTINSLYIKHTNEVLSREFPDERTRKEEKEEA